MIQNIKELNENIAVVVRARPFNNEETKHGYYEAWKLDPLTNTITSVAPPQISPVQSTPAKSTVSTAKTPAKSSSSSSSMMGSSSSMRTPAKTMTASVSAATPTTKFIPNEYTYDHLFLPTIENIDVYTRVAKEIIWSTMEGYNGTIFAYGQTASGKTFTMKGQGRRNPGIIPLAIQDVFAYIMNEPQREFLLRVSYMEIYNEVINDLLAPESINLKVHENPTSGDVYVGNLKEEIVLSLEHVLSVISAGEAHRHVGTTNYNDQSSRSHTIFRLVVESKPLDSDESHEGVRVSCLNLIDLAGSERASEGAHAIRNKEGAYINKSLLTLGTVISKLSEKAPGHIPYRDSKLTRILQTSLGGNAKIAIVCTVTLASNNFEETHSTLKFAQRAKKITNNAKVNEIVDDKTLIRQYRNEIAELKSKLEEATKREKDLDGKTTNEDLNKKLLETEKQRNLLESKIQHLTKLILVSASIGKAKKPAPSNTLSPSSLNPLSMSSTDMKRNTISSPLAQTVTDTIDAEQLNEHLKHSLEIEEREIQYTSRIAKLELELEQKSKLINTLESNNNNNINISTPITTNIKVDDKIILLEKQVKENSLLLKQKDDNILSLEFKIKGYTEKFKEFYSENDRLKKQVLQLQQQLQQQQQQDQDDVKQPNYNDDEGYDYYDDEDEMY